MDRLIRCDCGHEIVSGDLHELLERARGHARNEHHMAMSDAQLLAIAEPILGSPPSAATGGDRTAPVD